MVLDYVKMIMNYSVLASILLLPSNWLTELRFYVPLNTTWVISETFPRPISWFGVEKAQPKTGKAHIHQSEEMYYNT